MWKKIEKYINDHREEIDRDIPRDKVWARIENDLSGKQLKRKKRNLFESPLWKSAAVVLMLVGVGYIWINLLSGLNKPTAYTSSLLSGIQHIKTGFPELQEVDAHFSKELQQRMKVVEEYDLQQFDFTAGYMEKLKKVDQKITEQKALLKTQGLDHQAVQNLVENYNHKIALLDSLTAELEETK